MTAYPNILPNNLVMAVSEALDNVDSSVADHQLRVAYISTLMARHMGFRGTQLRDIFYAAVLHDIGLFRMRDRIRVIKNSDQRENDWHCEMGYLLLKDNECFAKAAPIVRYHHTFWNYGHGKKDHDQSVPIPSFILGLADIVDRNIDRSEPILSQTKTLRELVIQGRGLVFPPDCVDVFLEVSKSASFWLDLTSKRIYSILNREADWPNQIFDDQLIGSIAQIFARLVDSLSPWTGTHTAGVAETAVALAERMDFSPCELVLMRTAGYLHDLGKITVPSEILNKNGKPTDVEWAILQAHTYYTYRILDAIGGLSQIREWAAFHHERLDGKGYPFGLVGENLTLGARIMAVADVFTAVTEDRPYRKGMDDVHSMKVLNELVVNGGLDHRIVQVLQDDFDAINQIRSNEQAEYNVKQKTLLHIMPSEVNGMMVA